MTSSDDIREALKKGKENDILKELYKKVLPKSVRYVSKNGGKKEDAEDLFQDAVATLFQYSMDPKRDKIENIEAFSMIMIKNRWINQAVKNKRYTRDEFDHASSDDLNALVIDKEREKALRKAFEKLGETCKELLTLYYFNSLKMEKIAEKLGYNNRHTVKAKSHQCKKKLAEIIGSNEYMTEALTL